MKPIPRSLPRLVGVLASACLLSGMFPLPATASCPPQSYADIVTNGLVDEPSAVVVIGRLAREAQPDRWPLAFEVDAILRGTVPARISLAPGPAVAREPLQPGARYVVLLVPEQGSLLLSCKRPWLLGDQAAIEEALALSESPVVLNPDLTEPPNSPQPEERPSETQPEPAWAQFALAASLLALVMITIGAFVRRTR